MLTDFHIHSHNSDGLDSPMQIIDSILHLTKEKVFLSIVDHHSITFNTLQEHKNVTIIPGLEMSCEMGNTGVHLLAYATKIQLTDSLKEIFVRVNEGYRLRAQKIYNELLTKGYNMPKYSDLRIQGEAKSQVVYLNDLAEGLKHSLGSLTVQEVKKWAKENGNLLFTKEKKYLPSAAEAIQACKEAGLITIVAHPGRKIPIANLEAGHKLLRYVQELQELGIDGVEVFHPDHSKYHVEILTEYAQKNSLLVTVGTDYHGEGRGDKFLSQDMDEKYKNAFLNAIS